jgi:predicted dehydrogenase
MAKSVLKVGLIGGGGGAFIARPHQKAIHSDGTRRVVCAALHPDPAVAMAEARGWPYPIQGYPSYDALIEHQAGLPRSERIDYAVIVTPNSVHYDPARKLVEAGIPVFCEKPLTVTVRQAERLAAAVEKRRVPFGIAHTYIGHWSSGFSRWLVRSGRLGAIRWVECRYLQGWVAKRSLAGVDLASIWRTDPARAGASCCGGDIGTHAFMQVRFVTGLEVTRLRGMLEGFVIQSGLDDHFTTYCELSNGGRALIRASQIAIGHKNDLALEVNGSAGSLAWLQEEAEKVVIRLPDGTERTYWRGAVPERDAFLGRVPRALLAEPTLPAGHSEGFHDAYARLHRGFEADVRCYNAGKAFHCDGSRYANVHDGVAHMRFVRAAVRSARHGSRLVAL